MAKTPAKKVAKKATKKPFLTEEEIVWVKNKLRDEKEQAHQAVKNITKG